MSWTSRSTRPTTTPSSNTSPTAALSDKLDSVGWTVWVRRMIVLPIGERWAMIAVLTAVTTPRIVFYALLIGCAFAACYTTAGRVLRSLTRKAQRTDRAAAGARRPRRLRPARRRPSPRGLAARAPASPRSLPLAIALAGGAALVATAAVHRLRLAPGRPSPLWSYVVASGLAVARPLKGALDWLVPPVFRAAEYCTVLVLAARADVNGALPAAFGLVAAVAYHHYDTVYRIRGGTGAPPALAGAGHRRARGPDPGGGRARRPGHQRHDFTIALTALAVAVALVVLVESIRFWVSSGAPAVHDEGEPA